MASLPARGAGVRRLGLALPPARMPPLRAGRPLKRWRYVGVYTPQLMLCVGEASVAGVPQRWWALALPDGSLLERTTTRRGGVRLGSGRVEVQARAASGARVSIDLALDEPEPVEVASAHGRSYIWTAKRAPVGVRGRVAAGGHNWDLDGMHGFVDDSAGYHARHTAWRWSAGIGRSREGESVAWNLVEGVHDSPERSERTVWVDGEPREAGPVKFAPGLAGVGDLQFTEWSRREHRMSRGLARSSYSQPFGSFTGRLPGGPELAEGHGVMEEHDVRW